MLTALSYHDGFLGNRKEIYISGNNGGPGQAYVMDGVFRAIGLNFQVSIWPSGKLIKSGKSC